MDTPTSTPSTEDGWFVLNPNALFKLHVSGVDAATVSALQRALARHRNYVRDAEQPVLRIMAKAHGFRCREIDEFQAGTAPVFEAKVQQLLTQAVEWPELLAKGDAGLNRRRRLLHRIEEQVIRECGEMFRYIPALLADDTDVRFRVTATLICLTYVMAERGARDVVRREEIAPSIRGWSFLRMPGGCCPTCKAIPDELPPAPFPIVPVHVACGCSIHPVRR